MATCRGYPILPCSCRIAGAVPITPCGLQVGDLVVGQAEFGQQLVVVLAEQRRGLHVDALRARARA